MYGFLSIGFLFSGSKLHILGSLFLNIASMKNVKRTFYPKSDFTVLFIFEN